MGSVLDPLGIMIGTWLDNKFDWRLDLQIVWDI